ncbi:MAG: AtpZ/AtpI family protein [Bacteroidetes bacterium]|nr:AtpZ/AtpI family protein [Bacteroidota bacterium]MBT7995607.1 AtpZ/AtpI family protein [Bacteroidota bacterium]
MKKNSNNPPAYFRFISLGFQILATVLTGVLVGQWLDNKFESENSIFTIILSVVMIVVSMIYVVRTFLK